MRCKTCEYALWNLWARTCPECGTPFTPSEFDFVPNSVKFCCPHCGQDYYGTDEHGHLVPREFTCVKCAKPVAMDDMVLLPTAGLDEERTRVDVVPWLDRKRRAFFPRWFATIWMAMTGPGRMGRAIAQGGDARAWSAFVFAVVTMTAFAVFGWGWLMVLPLFIGPGVGFGLIAIGSWLVAVPVIAGVGLLVWSGVAHVILRVTGRTEGGFSRTLSCLSYSSATNVLSATPCFGPHLSMVSWIWWVVAGTVMLSAAQRVSGLRATLAVITLPLVLVVVLVLWIAVGVMTGLSSASVAGSMAYPGRTGMQAPASVDGVTKGLLSYAAAHNGASPPHALAAVADNRIGLSQLYRDGVPTRPGEGLVAGVDIMDVITMSPSERDEVVAKAARGLGPSPVAHRLGDMVFTYHGIDLSDGSAADPGLWLVVHAPLPEAAAAVSGASGTGPVTIVVGTLGNGVKVIPAQTWTEELAAQNVLRQAAGLGPLPDPVAVKQ